MAGAPRAIGWRRNPQSAFRNPQSAFRNPQSIAGEARVRV
jgi:hypothetical protein